VTSAVETGIRAAKTMLREGVSKTAFHDHYRADNRDLTEDIPFGQAMRLMVIVLARMGWFDPILTASEAEPKLHEALFDAVSGNRPYRRVWRNGLSPRSLGAILHAFLRHARRLSA